MDEKVKFVTQTGDKINMLWPGRRYALPFKNVIIDKFTQKTGMPHHSLLPNLSVFLRPDDMAVYNELQQLTMDWKCLDESTKDSTMKSMDTIMGKAMWGFWNVSNDKQISSADAATMDDINYPEDGFTELSAYILDDEELNRVLSSNMKSLKQVNDMHAKLIDNKWKADTNSMYHDDSFAQVMKKYPHIVCRIYQVECEDEETTCGAYRSIFVIITDCSIRICLGSRTRLRNEKDAAANNRSSTSCCRQASSAHDAKGFLKVNACKSSKL